MCWLLVVVLSNYPSCLFGNPINARQAEEARRRSGWWCTTLAYKFIYGHDMAVDVAELHVLGIRLLYEIERGESIGEPTAVGHK